MEDKKIDYSNICHQTFSLIYNKYYNAGLCEESESKIRITPYQLLKTSHVFSCIQNGETIGTFTIIRDNSFGLPMEDLYAEEIKERRLFGVSLAEISSLAHTKLGLKGVINIGRIIAQKSIEKNIDEVWIVCHPDHCPVYEKYVGFKKMGEIKAYEKVLGNLAVPMVLDIKNLKKNDLKMWKVFFEEKEPMNNLTWIELPNEAVANLA